MNKIIICFCLCYGSASAANARINSVLTNHVAIEQKGICLSVTDEDRAEAGGELGWLFDTELRAEAPLRWILHNTNAKLASVAFLGANRAFSIKLLDAENREISKTERGKQMSLGPAAVGDFGGSTHRLGVAGGGISIRDFPQLSGLFHFPGPGKYTFELRYWFWDIKAKKWQLSESIRVRVVKSNQEASAAAIAATNEVWVVDDGSIYLQSNNVRWLDPQKLAEAKTLPECQPTDADPAGNWGLVSQGLQMSLRFPKADYATNEPVNAILILRNLTDQDRWFMMTKYPVDFQIAVSRDGHALPRKDEPKDLTPFQQRLRNLVRNPQRFYVHPGTQRKVFLPISEMFDLSLPGVYTVSSSRSVDNLDISKPGKSEVVSGKAVFRVNASSQ